MHTPLAPTEHPLMIRLKDIAQRAGVSVMTVSKVMRDAPDISATTKSRIRSLAEEMGYTPNSIAQGLRNRTTRLFGLVIPAVTNPIFARLIIGLEERAHELGYDLILAHSMNLPEREEAAIRRLLSRRVDGLFLAPVYRLAATAPIYTELARRRLPVVLLGQRAPFCGQFTSVESDDVEASHLACRHLLELGHRRIAYFAGPPVVPSNQERFEGYRRALREFNLDVDDSLVFNAGSTIEEGELAARQMLQESPKATAIQCVNDLVAIGAARVLLAQGLLIPKHFSLVGFGNILLSEHCPVPLTSVRQPKFRLGIAAMDTMLKLLQGQPVAPIRIDAPLILRQSSGPPPLTGDR